MRLKTLRAVRASFEEYDALAKLLYGFNKMGQHYNNERFTQYPGGTEKHYNLAFLKKETLGYEGMLRLDGYSFTNSSVMNYEKGIIGGNQEWVYLLKDENTSWLPEDGEQVERTSLVESHRTIFEPTDAELNTTIMERYQLEELPAGVKSIEEL